uniref:Desiccation-related protein PCC13-62 n=1 Tax=Quercus lobata TaxID=97700 RepID=A0A7N2LVK3_QUELO
MALTITCTATITTFLISLIFLPKFYSSEDSIDNDYSSIPKSDVDLLEFPLNLEFLEAEFFLHSSLGYGLDEFAPNLTKGGPSPIGAKRANLDPFTQDIIKQFAFQEVGHLRAIQKTVKGFPRPLLDLSVASFAKVVDRAFGRPLAPPFDPYASGLNLLLASYLIPYVGLTGYVGANPKLRAPASKRPLKLTNVTQVTILRLQLASERESSDRGRKFAVWTLESPYVVQLFLVAGLLAVESGQDAIIRALLYERVMMKVPPYGITVAEFTDRFSKLRNNLGHAGFKDEGLVVPLVAGAKGKITRNVLVGDNDSIAFERTPEEVLRIVYGGGNEHKPGGFYPKGANGRIAKSHLHSMPTT